MENQEQVLLRLKEDILLRGLSQRTLESYSLHTRTFLKWSSRPVEQLNEDDVRKFLLYLIKDKKLAPATVNNYNAAIRFLFAVTFNRNLNYLQIPRQKNRKTLPAVLTRDEVATIIESSKTLKHKALLTVIYSSGLRVSEAAALKIQHIDSKNMRLFVANGKGCKDRYTLLSETCLAVLRKYFRSYRPKHPEGWFFLSPNISSHITYRGIEFAFEEALKRTSITKHVSVHTLRHAFATHLLEDGATLLQIKELLGHSSIQSTTVYLHLANLTSAIKSPLDNSPVYGSLEVSAHG
ncbi:MAG TPA: site-specific integrase [Syntrophomonas sp.]|jgi:integrase/recombinase XerD|nr:site-specific integrase [Syntrophomonas sp.]